jgi:hypothetical protein
MLDAMEIPTPFRIQTLRLTSSENPQTVSKRLNAMGITKEYFTKVQNIERFHGTVGDLDHDEFICRETYARRRSCINIYHSHGWGGMRKLFRKWKQVCEFFLSISQSGSGSAFIYEEFMDAG